MKFKIFWEDLTESKREELFGNVVREITEDEEIMADVDEAVKNADATIPLTPEEFKKQSVNEIANDKINVGFQAEGSIE